MTRIGSKIFYQGTVYEADELAIVFKNNLDARLYHSEYVNLQSSMNSRKFWAVSMGAVAIMLEAGYRSEREKNKELGLLGIVTAPTLIMWKLLNVTLFITTGAILISSISRKSKAKRALDRSISAFNTELSYGYDESIDLDLRMTENGVGLLYTF